MTSDRRKASTQAMRDVRPLLVERCGGNCERCGVVLPIEDGLSQRLVFEAHHRLMRSRGGGDGAANLVALDAQCHRWVHAHPHQAELEGYMLPSGSDPTVCVVQLRHWPCLLADDGTFTELDLDDEVD